MFDIVTAVPSAAIATGGTLQFAYPDGASAGSYAAYGHKAQARGMNNYMSQDAGDFSLAFTTVITMTYNGTTSIPAGKVVTLQINRVGQDDMKQYVAPEMKRMAAAPVYRIDLGTPKALDADGIAESQSVAAGANFVLNGVQSDLFNGANVKLDVPRAVNAAWTTASVLTITGKDEYGDVIVEQSASGTSHTGKKAFAEITSISSSASITLATVGWGDVLGLPVYVDKIARVIAEYEGDVQLAAYSDKKILIPFDFNQTDLLAPTAQNLVSPVAGYITGIRGVVQAAVTTGGAITVEANTVAVVGLSITVADGATAGTTHSDSVAKIATGLVAAGDDITVTPAAAFATAGAYKGFIEIEPIAELDGTFVAGVQTAPTATTGDTKGTYDPSEACDASKSFSLLVVLPDPSYKGVDNYDG